MKPEKAILAKPQLFYLRPAPGWIDQLHEEVDFLLREPFQKYKFQARAASIGSSVRIQNCDFRQGLEILYRITCAQDMIWLISEQRCESWDELESFFERLPLHSLFTEKKPETSHIHIKLTEGFTQNAKKIREKWEACSKTQTNSEETEWRFFLELRESKIRLLMSLSGDLLFKRKYKAHTIAVAPLAEHHAASCIRALKKAAAIDKEEKMTFWVPFAGSGTFGFEALISSCGIGAGAFDRKFAIDDFSFVSPQTLSFLRRKCREAFEKEDRYRIVFNELNLKAVQILKENSERVCSKQSWQIISGDFFDIAWPFELQESVVVLLNPPFGDRLGKKTSSEKLFQKIGEKLEKDLANHRGRAVVGCLCPNEATWRILIQCLGKKGVLDTFHFTQGGKSMRWLIWGK